MKRFLWFGHLSHSKNDVSLWHLSVCRGPVRNVVSGVSRSISIRLAKPSASHVNFITYFFGIKKEKL